MYRTIRHRVCGVGIAFAVLTVLLLGSTGIAIAITHGQPDGDAHPYVGMVVFDMGSMPAWATTGFLISPTVVVTAGHGTEGADAARVWFDSDLTGNGEFPYGGSTSTEGTPYTHPDFCLGCAPGLPGFDTHDVGVVILDEPVYLSEYAELPTEGMVDGLAMMSDLDLVGYGVQWMSRGGGPPRWRGIPMRHFAPAKLVASKHTHSDEFIKLTANPAQGKGGASFGDSGGPIFLEGTNIVLAVNSYITNYNATGVTYAQRLDIAPVLQWIAGF